MTSSDKGNLRDRVQERPRAQVATREGGQVRPLEDAIKEYRQQFQQALPQGYDLTRLARVAVTTINSNADLKKCTERSLLGALMTTVQLGLEPGPLGHAYFVPFYNKEIKAHEATFILGYKGIVALARRSGEISDVIARAVYPEDHFEIEYGTNEHLVHIPNLTGRTNGQPASVYYAIARYVGGGQAMIALTRQDVEKFRARSRAAQSTRSPWHTDYDPMACKTAIRRLAPFLPLEIGLARALNAEDTVRNDLRPEVIDVVPEFDAGTPNVLDPAGDDPASLPPAGEPSMAAHPFVAGEDPARCGVDACGLPPDHPVHRPQAKS